MGTTSALHWRLCPDGQVGASLFGGARVARAGLLAKCSAGILACEFWWRPAAIAVWRTGRDARLTRRRGRPRYFVTGPSGSGLECRPTPDAACPPREAAPRKACVERDAKVLPASCDGVVPEYLRYISGISPRFRPCTPAGTSAALRRLHRVPAGVRFSYSKLAHWGQVR
jgi:hypothetical protein